MWLLGSRANALGVDTGAQPDTLSQTPRTLAPAPQTSSKGGLGQGIQVHGWWTISVLNPDGTLVRHTEFENALQSGTGDLMLAQILGAQTSIGAWEVNVSPGGGTGV